MESSAPPGQTSGQADGDLLCAWSSAMNIRLAYQGLRHLPQGTDLQGIHQPGVPGAWPGPPRPARSPGHGPRL